MEGTYNGGIQGPFLFNDFALASKPNPNTESGIDNHHLVVVQRILVEVVLLFNIDGAGGVRELK